MCIGKTPKTTVLLHCGKELGRGSGGTAVAGMPYLAKFHGSLKCQKAESIMTMTGKTRYNAPF